ncbi:MAG TPA: hypothetical protein VM074_07930 [Solimonas sp.]|nr:hypothetical protein [Solimonas sp.]
MNRMTRKTLTTLALLGSLTGAALPAHADEDITALLAARVGKIIAAQGNAALVTIREDLTARIGDNLRPYLPSAAEVVRVNSDGETAPREAASRGSI